MKNLKIFDAIAEPLLRQDVTSVKNFLVHVSLQRPGDHPQRRHHTHGITPTARRVLDRLPFRLRVLSGRACQGALIA